MKEKLIIKNFGPIKSVDLDLGKMNILIGEQATGKSTIAKVLAVCRFFSYIIDYKLLKDFDGPFVEGLRYWGISDYLKDNTYVYYKNADYSVEVTPKKRIIVNHDNDNLLVEKNDFLFEPSILAISSRFTKLLNELDEIKPTTKIRIDEELDLDLNWTPSETFFRTSVKKVMDNPFYFPTERGLQSLYSLPKSAINNFSDSLFDQLAQLYKISTNYKSETFIKPLNIFYKNENGRGYVKEKDSNAYHSLENGASGYQSTIPIVLVIKYYNEIERRKRTFIIEEPEQNLFPTAQKALVEFLVASINKYNNTFIIPTHSPYIISVLNNLISAYRVGQNNEKEVNRIIDKKFWISIDDVSAYKLYFDDKSGGIISNNLVLQDLKEISIDYLDDISATINNDWDKILNVEHES